ncbi:MAG: hypothetical protein HOW71_33530 [Nonomuraea sp.]|nr:hypothetical protein [Nonomuraea sp.]
MPLKAAPRLEWPGNKNARYVGRRRIIAENPERFRRLRVVNQTRLRNARRFLAGELKATW